LRPERSSRRSREIRADRTASRRSTRATNALSGAIRNGNALAGSVVRLIGPSIWVADQGAVTAVGPRSLQRVAAPLTVVDSPGASVVAIDGDAGAIWILTGTGVVRVIPARLGP